MYQYADANFRLLCSFQREILEKCINDASLYVKLTHTHMNKQITYRSIIMVAQQKAKTFYFLKPGGQVIIDRKKKMSDRTK